MFCILHSYAIRQLHVAFVVVLDQSTDERVRGGRVTIDHEKKKIKIKRSEIKVQLTFDFRYLQFQYNQ